VRILGELLRSGLSHVPNRNDAPWSCLKKLD
jgi:hypothetical protein